ncbi:Do family serine endopeptidase [soil metagenome]
MKRHTRPIATVLLLPILAAAGCQEMGDSVRAAFAQQSGASAANPDAQERVRQQLGEINGSPIDTASAARLSGAFRAAASQALPAVVQITTIVMSDNETSPFPGFPGLQPETEPQPSLGAGSGFFIDSDGHILTNHHVVRGALHVNVVLLDGREFTAEVIGSDPNSDVAVIKVDANGEALPVSVLGDSDQLRVGDWVLALGNPLGLTFTATAGIVSAKGRNIGILAATTGENTALESFIQTDAAINPGNSGGPLVDLHGRVVGINTAIQSVTGYNTGAGFAIPIDLARKFANDIISYGVVHRPRLGVSIQDVSAADAAVYKLPSVTGVEVISVSEGTPAARAGLELGDVITSLNNQPVNTVSDLQARVARFQPGDRVNVGFIRYGNSRQATVPLGEFAAVAPEPSRREASSGDGNRLGFNVIPLSRELADRLDLRGDQIPVVAVVDRIGAAFPAGLRRGHVIRKFNGRDIRSIRELERAATSVRRGDIVSLIVLGVAEPEPAPTIINYRVR